MTRTLAVTLAVLVLLAGCPDVLPSPDEPERTPTGIESEFDDHSSLTPAGNVTKTPAASGNDTEPSAQNGAETEPEQDYLAPGVTTDGVTNVSLLIDRHYAILERESGNGTYEAVLRRNRTTIELFPFRRRQVSTSRERYVVQFPERRYYSGTRTDRTAAGPVIYETWLTASESLLRVDRPGEPVKYSVPDGTGAPGHPQKPVLELQFGLPVKATQQNDATTVEERYHDGSTVYVLSRASITTRRGTTTKRTRTVSVREDGFVSKVVVESISESASGEITAGTLVVTFEIHPGETVEPPGWTEAAREAVTGEETADDD